MVQAVVRPPLPTCCKPSASSPGPGHAATPPLPVHAPASPLWLASCRLVYCCWAQGAAAEAGRPSSLASIDAHPGRYQGAIRQLIWWRCAGQQSDGGCVLLLAVAAGPSTDSADARSPSDNQPTNETTRRGPQQFEFVTAGSGWAAKPTPNLLREQ